MEDASAHGLTVSKVGVHYGSQSDFSYLIGQKRIFQLEGTYIDQLVKMLLLFRSPGI